MTTMRLPYHALSPELLAGFRTIKSRLETGSLDRSLVELVYLRVSQMNGCAYCLGMHGQYLRQNGEPAQRLDCLAGWRVSALYSDAERAALAWAEAVTAIGASGAQDDVYQPLKQHFSDVQISELTFAIATMNALNRLAIAMRQ